MTLILVDSAGFEPASHRFRGGDNNRYTTSQYVVLLGIEPKSSASKAAIITPILQNNASFTVVLPGFEPGLFPFKAARVANYTIGQYKKKKTWTTLSSPGFKPFMFFLTSVQTKQQPLSVRVCCCCCCWMKFFISVINRIKIPFSFVSTCKYKKSFN